MSRTVLVSFDLEDASSEDYEKAYKALDSNGLSRWSPAMDLRMPGSTVLGNTDVGGNGADLARNLKDAIELACGKTVSHLVAGVVSGWGMYGPQAETTGFAEEMALMTRRIARKVAEKWLAENP